MSQATDGGIDTVHMGEEAPAPTTLRRQTENFQALFETLEEQPGNIDGELVNKDHWSRCIGAATRDHSSLDYRVQNRDDMQSMTS